MIMLEKMKEKLSNIEVTLVTWLLSLSGILMIRFFLEAISSPTSTGVIASDAPTLIHYFLFYLGVGLGLMLILQVIVPTWKKVLPQAILFVLTLTFIPPIIDWITSGGRGVTMAYLFESPAEMGRSFLTFFGPFVPAGITLGIRVELAILILGVGVFVYCVRKSILRSLVAMIVLYVVAFVAISLPGIISTLAGVFGGGYIETHQFIQTSILQSSTLADNIHGTLRYGSLVRMLEIGFDFMIGRIWFIVSAALAGVWFFTNFKRQTSAILKNSRLGRIVHYIFMVLLGAFVAYRLAHFSMNWNDWLVMVILLSAFYFAWMFAVCVNDIFDIEIDRVSNSERPITSGSLSVSETKSAAYIFLVLSLVGAYLCGYYAFFCILAFTALYYVYSAPPVRLKRIPFLSVFVVGFCSLATVMAGFFTFSPLKEVSAFPANLIIAVVVIFSLLPQIKDIKDIEGDRVAGIMTLPTLFGAVWGPRIVGLLAGLAYLVVPLLASTPALFIGAIPAAGITYWLAVRKPYVEGPIFIVYGLFAVFVAIICIF
jgi:4-hydroxybenzoate polyprenyltransferase